MHMHDDLTFIPVFTCVYFLAFGMMVLKATALCSKHTFVFSVESSSHSSIGVDDAVMYCWVDSGHHSCYLLYHSIVITSNECMLMIQ